MAQRSRALRLKARTLWGAWASRWVEAWWARVAAATGLAFGPALLALVGLWFASGPGDAVSEQRSTFPKPALESRTWQAEADSLALRVHAALDVPLDRAAALSGWILEAAARAEVQPELIAGLVFVESSFRTDVVSVSNAVGPAQVKPFYWAEFCGVEDLTEPEQNIYCGAQVLAYLIEQCGALDCALMGYNTGLNSERRQAGLRYASRVVRYGTRLGSI